MAKKVEALAGRGCFWFPSCQFRDEYPRRLLCRKHGIPKTTCSFLGELAAWQRLSGCFQYFLFERWWNLRSVVAFRYTSVLGAGALVWDKIVIVMYRARLLAQCQNNSGHASWSRYRIHSAAVLVEGLWLAISIFCPNILDAHLLQQLVSSWRPWRCMANYNFRDVQVCCFRRSSAFSLCQTEGFVKLRCWYLALWWYGWWDVISVTTTFSRHHVPLLVYQDCQAEANRSGDFGVGVSSNSKD